MSKPEMPDVSQQEHGSQKVGIGDDTPHTSPHIGSYFSKFSHAAARATGTPTAFLMAAAVVVVWSASGPMFHYSDTWQLVINTGTTIITFLMVFLIQNTQNRDTMAIQLKLAELIIAMKGAENRIATIEDLSEEDLDRLHKELCGRVQQTSDALSNRRRAKATGV